MLISQDEPKKSAIHPDIVSSSIQKRLSVIEPSPNQEKQNNGASRDSFTVNEILKYIAGNPKPIGLKGVRIRRHRFLNFLYNGTACQKCGIEGKIFILKKIDKKEKHLNLFADLGKGKMMLINKDHILPRSFGGVDCIHNLQVLCQKCNTTKGAKWNPFSLFKRLLNAYKFKKLGMCGCKWHRI